MSDKNEPMDFVQALKLQWRLAQDAPALRDLFAVAALQGMLSHGDPGYTHAYTAENAYAYADAMMKVRKLDLKRT